MPGDLQKWQYKSRQWARTIWYGGHYVMTQRLTGGFSRPDEPGFTPPHGEPDGKALRRAYYDLYAQDWANIEAGLYPVPNDFPLSKAGQAWRSMRQYFSDIEAVNKRRLNRDGVEIRDQIDDKRYPAYYRQNFHYQSDGWFSENSAELYDTQVEVLFTGTARLMRRAALAELVKILRGQRQDRMQVLDLACGNGLFMQQILQLYPRLKLQGLDLSPAYCEKARQALRQWPQADIIEAPAEAMPIEDASHDAVISIYLFHELPPRMRRSIAAEIARILKPNGWFIFADSLQLGDNPPLNGMLDYFPEGFHEPFFSSYIKEDFDQMFGELHLKRQATQLAYLTKITRWQKL